MDITAKTSSLSRIVDLSTDKKDREKAYLLLKTVKSNVPYSDEELIKFINQAEEKLAE